MTRPHRPVAERVLRRRRRGRIVAASLVLFALGDNAAALPASDAAVDGVRISPDGDRVLAIVSSTDRQGVGVIDLQGGELRIVMEPDIRNRVLDGCGWAADDRIVCSMFVFPSNDGAPYPRRRRVRLVAVDADGSRPLALMNQPPRRPPKLAGVVRGPPIPLDDLEHVIVDHLPEDRDHILVAAPREATPYTSVYRVNIRDGRFSEVLGYRLGIVNWHTDWAGRVRVGTGWYEYGHDLRSVNGRRPEEPWIGPTAVAADATGELERADVSELSGLIGARDLVGPHVLGFTLDGSRVYYNARVRGADRNAVWEADPRTLSPIRRIASDEERDVEAVAVAGRACGVVGFMHPLPGRAFTWLDDAFGADVAAAESRVDGEIVAVPSMSADCRRVVLAASDGLTHRTFHLLDRKDGTIRALGRQNSPAATSNEGGKERGKRENGLEQRRLRYTTRDGSDLPMTLTLPAARTTDARPVIVLFDGGAPRDSVAPLDGWPAFFASRGYAVAQPAFRGAEGYGAAFRTDGLRHRGAKLSADVADALAWLEASGLGDADRACFAGRGRGAHLALVAASDGIADAGSSARCAALFSPLDVALTKRDHRAPYGQCSAFPCGDWMRWAAPHAWQRAMGGGSALAEAADDSADFGESPLVGAAHPGFPILIQGGGKPVVYERDSRRFDAELRDLGFPEHIAPVGSRAEDAFLDAADRLFSRVLDGRASDR